MGFYETQEANYEYRKSMRESYNKGYEAGYEQAKEDCIKAVRDCYENILDVETDGHTIADSVEDVITEKVRRTE